MEPHAFSTGGMQSRVSYSCVVAAVFNKIINRVGDDIRLKHFRNMRLSFIEL